MDIQSRPEPVNAYIKYKLGQLEAEFDYTKPALQQMSIEIHQRAQNTFLWVSLVFKGIFDGNMLQTAAIKYIQTTPSDLTDLYNKLMARIEKESLDVREYCVGVLATSCLSSRPLSFSEVHLLAALPENVNAKEILPRCGSFLAIKDDAVRVIHNSARKYLNEYFESHSQTSDVRQRHIELATRSIYAMSKALKQNIYNISHETASKDVLGPKDDPIFSLRYSCEFWVGHLCKGEGRSMDDGVVVAFMEGHFLHWLESLSLIQKLPSAVSCIRQLSAMFQVCFPVNDIISKLINIVT
jgi:hypothetical protein